MNGIDDTIVDEVIASTFEELRTALSTHSEKGIELYSLALRALVPLRQQLVDDHVRSLPRPRGDR
jgi:hypothetical protein